EMILEKTKPKAVIRGEPEATVLEICTKESLNDIKGITFKVDGKVVTNENREPLDMTILPIPAYHLLDSSKYHYEVMGDHFALFEGSRGCYYQCKFCLKEMFGNPIRSKHPEQLIKEVDEAITKHGVKFAQFIDLEYTLNKEMYHKVLDHLIEKNYDFKWCCQARADNLDPELLKKMKKAGCQMILCGIESGSEKTLKVIRKGLTLEKVKRGIAEAKKAGIDTVCFFMFGFPGETKEDMQETIKFTKELNPTYVSFHDLIPHKTTEMYNVKEELNNQKLAQSMRRLGYIHFYLRPSYLMSRLFRGNIFDLGKQLKLFWGFVR
ncbi:MAG: radical SAM protein, partial [Candidatus Woesearchaeota archaeon]|nr:radical SAM protein [Candidatus Woesearchaeota archaeon]